MDFETIVNEVANGTIIEFPLSSPSFKDDCKLLGKFMFPEHGKIKTYCTGCKSKETFEVEEHIFSWDGDCITKRETLGINGSLVNGTTKYSAYALYGEESQYPSFYVEGNSFPKYLLFYSLTCDFDCQTNYVLLLCLDLTNGKMRLSKIGQIPPLHVVGNSDKAEFRPFLEEIDAYDDYMNAMKSHEDHLDAGACCYLRRVVTSMIKYYKGKCPEDIPDSLKTKDKLTILENKGIIDADAKEFFDKAYSNLSEGDHNLSEEDDGRYYPDFISAVDMQLEEETSKREHEKKKAEIKRRTNAVSQEIASKK
jgi:hypothetical protein